MEHSFSGRPNGKFSGRNNGTSEKAVLKFFRRMEYSKRKFVLNLLKPIFDIKLQAFAPFYNFLLKELEFVQMVNTIGEEKLPVLNFSHHSPIQPTSWT